MPEAVRPRLHTIPPHRAFADALVAGILAEHSDRALGVARGMVILPNARAVRSVRDAFVRASGSGLLLPRLAAIGDEDLGESLGVALDPLATRLPPPIDPIARRLLLTQLVQRARQARGEGGEADEALRLAGDLGRVLDQFAVEGVDPLSLESWPPEEELQAHWKASLQLLEIVTRFWPDMLADRERSDLQQFRNAQLEGLAARWREAPPSGWVIAAGISVSAPAAARLLRVVSELQRGAVVFAGLDTEMPAAEWGALGPHEADPVTGFTSRPIESHPQYQLKLLLQRMGVGRGELDPWPHGDDRSAPRRTATLTSALRPPAFTDAWIDPGRRDLGLAKVRFAQFETAADEAQGIALRLREVLETPGRTGALVTPDRALARRVAAHLQRWEVAVDDSAGTPLSATASGTLPLLIAEAAAEAFPPARLLALLGHPLVRAGETRGAWLTYVRAADRKLRGPRPAPGLAAIGEQIGAGLATWWEEVAALLAPIAELFQRDELALAEAIACLRETATALSDGAIWAGPAGRAAAGLFEQLEAAARDTPLAATPGAIAPMLRQLMDEVAVRPPQGGHPRLAILGLVEARLHSADLVVVGGLNEGVWPPLPPPDPWLAPRIRAHLGLPGLERRIGVAAHDFAHAMGAEEVLLTRAMRDASAPTVASRLLLRLQAMAGPDLIEDRALPELARAIDRPAIVVPAERPRPAPPVAERPRKISVTEVDRLKADPYAFYAKRMLGLNALDPVDADASAAWRGTAVHSVLEAWALLDGGAPEALIPRARAMLDDPGTHPLTRALWSPRLLSGLEWVARTLAERRREGWEVLAAEEQGDIDVAGVNLRGKFDRIDRMPGGALCVIDYKTGQPPSNRAVLAGYSLQLGLIGLIAERGGFRGIEGRCGGFEYWSLARDGDGFGKVVAPTEARNSPVVTEDFVALALQNFAEAAGRWLTGSEPFNAKLHPEYAPYADYDQLMRLDEWYGRG